MKASSSAFQRNIKTALVAVLLAWPSYGMDLVRLSHPNRFTTTEANLTVQGTIELAGPTEVEIRVRPFFDTGKNEIKSFRWPVLQGRFSGNVRLWPGLNLLSIETPGRGVSGDFAIAFLPIPDSPLPREWGSQTPILFSQPRDLRAEKPSIPVAGLLSEDIPQLFLLNLSPTHLYELTKKTKEGGSVGVARVTRIFVTNRAFSSQCELRPGANTLFVRPDSSSASFERVAVKSVIYEPSSPLVTLEPLVMRDNVIQVRGQVKGKEGNEVITILKQFSRTSGGGFSPQLIQTSVQVSSGGKFSLELPSPFQNKDQYPQGFPLLEVRWGKKSTFRVLLPPSP